MKRLSEALDEFNVREDSNAFHEMERKADIRFGWITLFVLFVSAIAIYLIDKHYAGLPR